MEFDTIFTTFEAEKVCILLAPCNYIFLMIFRMNLNDYF
jgi:hypothetical protein